MNFIFINFNSTSIVNTSRNTSNIMMHQFVKNYPTKIGHIKTILTFMLDMGP